MYPHYTTGEGEVQTEQLTGNVSLLDDHVIYLCARSPLTLRLLVRQLRLLYVLLI